MNTFANYIVDDFPKIKVIFGNNIKNNDDYKKFEDDWLKCYEYKKKFIFIFDTSNVGMINIKYMYRLTLFIKSLKKKIINNPNNFNYLQYSIIIVNNFYIKHLLNLTFMIQKPVAPVYIIDKKYNFEKLYYNLKNNEIINDDEVIYISN